MHWCNARQVNRSFLYLVRAKSPNVEIVVRSKRDSGIQQRDPADTVGIESIPTANIREAVRESIGPTWLEISNVFVVEQVQSPG